MTGSHWDRFALARISRRRALGYGAALAAAGGAIAVVGCRSKEPGDPPRPTATPADGRLNASGEPQGGGRFQDYVQFNFDGFDPHLGAVTSTGYFPRLYNVLVNQSPTRPEVMFFDLAESLEQPDDVTWNFKIRRGVRIAPNALGVPERDLDASDAVASFERMKTAVGATNGGFMRDYVDSVRADADVVTIKTLAPYAWFLSRIGLFVSTIAPREAIADDAATARLRDRSAGAGPFVLTSSSEGEGAKLDRNPNYYRRDDASGAALPYADGIDVRIITDASTARTAFLSGQLDTYNTATSADADELAGKHFTVDRQPYFSYVSVIMNIDRPPFNDARVRRAVSRAIDRSQLVDVVYRGAAAPDGLVHWPTGPYALNDADLATYQPHDPADARALISAAGGDASIRLSYPGGTPQSQIDLHVPVLVEQLKAAGFDVTEEPQDFGTWAGSFRGRNYQIMISPNGVFETPELPLSTHRANGPFNDGTLMKGPGVAEVDDAIRRANQTIPFEERVANVHAAQAAIYANDPIYLPLVSPYSFTGYSERVHGIRYGIGTSALFDSSWWLSA